MFTKANPGKQSSKRCSPTSPGTSPPPKSPRTDMISPTTETPDVAKGQPDIDVQEVEPENSDEHTGSSVSPTAHRKSWRRSTISRRSLPALPNPYQGEMWGFMPIVKYGHGVFFFFFFLFIFSPCNINIYLCVYDSFVWKHKHILITPWEDREINGGFDEGMILRTLAITNWKFK